MRSILGNKRGRRHFGVIASMTLALVPLKRVFGGIVYYHMKDAADIVHFYREWTSELGPETSTALRLMRLPPKPKFLEHALTKICALTICHAEEASAEALHRHLTAFKSPVLEDLRLRPLSEMAAFDEASNMDNSTTFSHLECLRELTDGVLKNLLRAAEERIPAIMQLELQHLRGNDTDGPPVAFTTSRAEYWLHLVSPAINTTLAELAIATKEAFGALGPVYTGEVAYNYLSGDQQERAPDAFDKAKYQRLRELKCQYNPDSVFHLNLNITSASAS